MKKVKLDEIQIESGGTPVTTNIFLNGKLLENVQKIVYEADVNGDYCMLNIFMNPKVKIIGKVKIFKNRSRNKKNRLNHLNKKL